MSTNTAPLTEKEIEYLSEGKSALEDSAYRPHEIEQRIEKKVAGLPQRLQRILLDIQALEDRLDGGHWAESWEEMIANHEKGDSLLFPSNQHEKSVAWGRSIGELVSTLNGHIAEADRKQVIHETLWGILKGVYGLNEVGEVEAYDSIEDAIEELERLAKKERKSREQLADAFQEDIELRRERSERLLELIADVLELNNIEPREWIIGEVASELNQIGEVVDYLYGSGDKYILHEIYELDMIESIIEQNRLDEKQQLVSHLKQDVTRLEDKGARIKGVPNPGVEVLNRIISQDDSTSSREIAEYLADEFSPSGKRKNWTAGVTRLCRDLAGVEKTPSGRSRPDVWTTRPILKGDRDGWIPTAYGRLLHYYRGSPSNVSGLGPSEDVVSQVLDTIVVNG